ncbi:hypothetical protein D9M71_482540 [compost metagenome]
MGDPQAAADQQALAIDPVGFGQGLGNTFSHPFGALWLAARVDQQRELVAAQAGHLVAGLKLAFQAPDHLQDQPVTGLMAKRIVGPAKVVQVQVTEGHPTPVVVGQACGQQGLKALAVGDTGQRILFGQAQQGGLQHTALAHMAQAAAQGIGAELVKYQPVADTRRWHLRFMLKQQHHRQDAAAGRRLQLRGGQHQGITVIGKQAVDCVPVRCGQQHRTARQRRQAITQGGGPFRLVSQQEQTQGFDRRRQAGSLGRGHSHMTMGSERLILNH